MLQNLKPQGAESDQQGGGDDDDDAAMDTTPGASAEDTASVAEGKPTKSEQEVSSEIKDDFAAVRGRGCLFNHPLTVTPPYWIVPRRHAYHNAL
jgi:hypothetical protein